MSKPSKADARPAEADMHNPRTIDNRAPEPVDPADSVAVEAGLADMRAGRIATPAEIEAAYARFGRVSR